MSVRKYERRESLMEVQTKAIDLAVYTKNKAGNEKIVPKRDRWSVGIRLIDRALDLATSIDLANSYDLYDDEEAKERYKEQRHAMALTFCIMTLVHVVMHERNLEDTYMHWTGLVVEVQELLRGWMDSDRRRRKKHLKDQLGGN